MQLLKKPIHETSGGPDLGALMSWPMIVSRTVPLPGRRVKLRLEAVVWSGLEEIADKENRLVQDLCKEVDARRPSSTSLTSAIRSFVLDYFRHAEAT